MGAARRRSVMAPGDNYTRYLSWLPPLNKHRQSPPSPTACTALPAGRNLHSPGALPAPICLAWPRPHPSSGPFAAAIPSVPCSRRGKVGFAPTGCSSPKGDGTRCWGSPAPTASWCTREPREGTRSCTLLSPRAEHLPGPSRATPNTAQPKRGAACSVPQFPSLSHYR